jgi:uncharacterized protein (DUF58 family)
MTSPGMTSPGATSPGMTSPGVMGRASPQAFAAATLIAWALFLGVLLARAELFVAAIPLALGFLSVTRPHPFPRYKWQQTLSTDRLAEGDKATVSVTLSAVDPVPMAEILAAVPPFVRVAGGSSRIVLRAAAGESTGWRYVLAFPARGRFDLGEFHVRMWDLSGLQLVETRIAQPKPIAVYPHVAPVRRVPRPLRTQASLGNYVSARLGDGIEPGDLRRFLPGDRIRRINWRASLRRGQLYVTQFHEERNADVVLLLDILSETGPRPHSTLDLCVRAAASLAQAYLARKDRVGFVEYGGYLRWIDPGTGQRQSRVLVDGLLPAATHFSYVAPALDRLPPRVLPPQALVIALSPLLDERFVKAILDLAARRFDLVVLALSPVEPTQRMLVPNFPDDLACRLWAIQWRAAVDELRARGLTILEWQADTPLDLALEPLARSRPGWAARR